MTGDDGERLLRDQPPSAIASNSNTDAGTTSAGKKKSHGLLRSPSTVSTVGFGILSTILIVTAIVSEKFGYHEISQKAYYAAMICVGMTFFCAILMLTWMKSDFWDTGSTKQSERSSEKGSTEPRQLQRKRNVAKENNKPSAVASNSNTDAGTTSAGKKKSQGLLRSPSTVSTVGFGILSTILIVTAIVSEKFGYHEISQKAYYAAMICVGMTFFCAILMLTWMKSDFWDTGSTKQSERSSEKGSTEPRQLQRKRNVAKENNKPSAVASNSNTDAGTTSAGKKKSHGLLRSPSTVSTVGFGILSTILIVTAIVSEKFGYHEISQKAYYAAMICVGMTFFCAILMLTWMKSDFWDTGSTKQSERSSEKGSTEPRQLQRKRNVAKENNKPSAVASNSNTDAGTTSAGKKKSQGLLRSPSTVSTVGFGILSTILIVTAIVSEKFGYHEISQKAYYAAMICVGMTFFCAILMLTWMKSDFWDTGSTKQSERSSEKGSTEPRQLQRKRNVAKENNKPSAVASNSNTDAGTTSAGKKKSQGLLRSPSTVSTVGFGILSTILIVTAIVSEKFGYHEISQKAYYAAMICVGMTFFCAILMLTWMKSDFWDTGSTKQSERSSEKGSTEPRQLQRKRNVAKENNKPSAVASNSNTDAGTTSAGKKKSQGLLRSPSTVSTVGFGILSTILIVTAIVSEKFGYHEISQKAYYAAMICVGMTFFCAILMLTWMKSDFWDTGSTKQSERSSEKGSTEPRQLQRNRNVAKENNKPSALELNTNTVAGHDTSAKDKKKKKK